MVNVEIEKTDNVDAVRDIPLLVDKTSDLDTSETPLVVDKASDISKETKKMKRKREKAKKKEKK